MRIVSHYAAVKICVGPYGVAHRNIGMEIGFVREGCVFHKGIVGLGVIVFLIHVGDAGIVEGRCRNIQPLRQFGTVFYLDYPMFVRH